MSNTRDRDEALRLYVEQGLNQTEIAAVLDKSRNTISAWKRADKAAGRDWDQLRSQRVRKSPFTILEVLEARFERLVEAEEQHANDAGYDDRLWKLSKTIEARRERLADSDTVLTGLDVFGAWAAVSVDEPQLGSLRDAVAQCIADLRSGTFRLPT